MADAPLTLRIPLLTIPIGIPSAFTVFSRHFSLQRYGEAGQKPMNRLRICIKIYSSLPQIANTIWVFRNFNLIFLGQ